jgi:cyclase
VRSSSFGSAMELRQIAPDVYTCLQEDRGLGCSNSGLIRRGGGLIVDTFWDLPHTREMIRLYSSVWDGPARRVVNTHANGDHCWGNQLFPEAEIIGHRLCAERFEREARPEALQALKSSGGGGDPALEWFAEALADFDFSGIELRPPTRIVEERLELDQDGIGLEILYVGPAHTPGDVIVWLPEQKIVFAGDILFWLCTPIGWEGTYARWYEALDRIAALEPEIVVPGHGPICGVEGPTGMKAYLGYVYSESRRLFDAGIPVEDAAGKIDLGPYADWTEPERIVFQVERAYREFRGDPPDLPIDATGLFGRMHDLRTARARRPGQTQGG